MHQRHLSIDHIIPDVIFDDLFMILIIYRASSSWCLEVYVATESTLQNKTLTSDVSEILPRATSSLRFISIIMPL